MIQKLYSKYLLPFFEGTLKGRNIFGHLAELERSQWWSRAEIEAYQTTALRNLLQHAAATCPYFSETWATLGLNPAAVESLEDLRAWPVTQRATINQNRAAMRSRQPGLRLLSKSTGGSSGVPLHFDLDVGSHNRRAALVYRGYGWAGAGPGTKQYYLWGIPLGEQTRWQRCKDAVFHRFHRRTMINCFDLGPERVGAFLRTLNRSRPDVIIAYTSALYTFARMLQKRGERPFSPKGILVGAEKLWPFQRELIEEVFQAPIFETYGSREVMLTAAECERHEGLHLSAENLLVEILDDDGQPVPVGQEGNVVITDLFNYGMPFVRYANGDRAVAAERPCSCGRGLPMLSKVVGRQLDVLHMPDGRRIPGEFFPHLVMHYPAVERFQVIQDALDHVELRMVLADPLTTLERQMLHRKITQKLGAAVHFEMLTVDDIPLTRAGKHQVVVNRCQNRPETAAV